MNVLAISGSLKARSSNLAILHAAQELAADRAVFAFVEQQLATVPAFNPDLDAVGSPPASAVAELRAQLARADAVIVSSPEYAHGVPGALKNAFDWIVSSGELTDKPVLVLVTSASGGPFARAAWREIFTTMGARVVADEPIVVPRGGWDADQRLVDERTRAQLRGAVARLIAAVSSM